MRSKYTFLLLFAFVWCSHVAQAQVITTFAGNGVGASTGSGSYTGDGGFAYLAGLNSCTAVTFDGAGNIYIADRDNNVIRKVDVTTGIITTFAGRDTAGYSGDGGSAILAKMNKPYGVASDVPGNVYVADYNNHVVRKISTSGIITTYAGTGGTPGYSGDGGAATAAKLNSPQGIAVDQFDNVYVSEAGNNIVRKIAAGTGVISTVAGSGTFGYGGDGGNAVGALLYGPAGIAVDVFGNIFIADYYNNVIRKVDTGGIISTFAGNNTIGNTGDGGAAVSAQLHTPSGVSMYGHGDVYISDQGNNTIRKVDSTGRITRVAGTTTNGYTGDTGNPLNAELASPKGLAVDGLGRVFIADYDNNVIRLITHPEAVNPIPAEAGAMHLYPNPASGSFTVTLPKTVITSTITLSDVTGKVVMTIAGTRAQSVSLNTSHLPAGSYFVKADAGGKIYTAKIVLQ